MNLLNTLLNPARHLTRAVLLPLKAIWVVGLCALINALTSPNHWWVQWVALGMGIAVLATWLRAGRTLLTLALLAWAGRWAARRWNSQPR